MLQQRPAHRITLLMLLVIALHGDSSQGTARSSGVPGKTALGLPTGAPLVSGVVCADSRTVCPPQHTCCALGSNNFACCPIAQGICCKDRFHCCPSCYTCNAKQASCDRTPSIPATVSMTALKPAISIVLQKPSDGQSCVGKGPDGLHCQQTPNTPQGHTKPGEKRSILNRIVSIMFSHKKQQGESTEAHVQPGSKVVKPPVAPLTAEDKSKQQKLLAKKQKAAALAQAQKIAKASAANKRLENPPTTKNAATTTTATSPKATSSEDKTKSDSSKEQDGESKGFISMFTSVLSNLYEETPTAEVHPQQGTDKQTVGGKQPLKAVQTRAGMTSSKTSTVSKHETTQQQQHEQHLLQQQQLQQQQQIRQLQIKAQKRQLKQQQQQQQYQSQQLKQDHQPHQRMQQQQHQQHQVAQTQQSQKVRAKGVKSIARLQTVQQAHTKEPNNSAESTGFMSGMLHAVKSKFFSTSDTDKSGEAPHSHTLTAKQAAAAKVVSKVANAVSKATKSTSSSTGNPVRQTPQHQTGTTTTTKTAAPTANVRKVGSMMAEATKANAASAAAMSRTAVHRTPQASQVAQNVAPQRTGNVQAKTKSVDGRTNKVKT